MTKIAFMFPGQGSMEAGMGRDVAEAVPEAMAVYDVGSEASGHGPQGALLRAARRRSRRHRGAAAGARRDVPLARRRPSLARHQPDVVVGHSVGEFSALGSAHSMSVRDAIALVRERGVAMAEAAGAPGVDGGANTKTRERRSLPWNPYFQLS